MKRYRRNVGGFTLIELLVVIAVITLLLAILMPTLRMAREQARCVVCASQLRQWGITIGVYANDNDDFMPPNFLFSQYYPYVVYEPQNGHYRNLGHLFDFGYITQPKMYYCASETNEGHKFDTSINPWLVPHPSNPGEGYTRMSYYYYTRIEEVFWNPILRAIRNNLGLAKGNSHFVKVTEIRNKAILSDNIYIPKGFPHWIRNGFNVLYGDVGVKFWRDKTGFFEDIESQGYVSAQNVYDIFDMFDQNR